MSRAAGAAGIAVGLLGPGLIWLGGERTWAASLWLGAAVGLASFLWIRLASRRLFAPGAEPHVPKTWWWHSLLRLSLTAGLLFLSVSALGLPAAGVLAGFTVAQLTGAVSQARADSKSLRGAGS